MLVTQIYFPLRVDKRQFICLNIEAEKHSEVAKGGMNPSLDRDAGECPPIFLAFMFRLILRIPP